MKFMGWNISRSRGEGPPEPKPETRTALATEPLESAIESDDKPYSSAAFLDVVRDGYRYLFNEKEHGCAPFTTAATYRASRTYDSGFSVEFEDGADREKVFVENFIKSSKLRGSLGLRASITGEIQGQCAFRLRRQGAEIAEIKLDVLTLVNLTRKYYDYYERGYQVNADGTLKNIPESEGELVILSGLWRYDADEEIAITPPRLAKGFKYCEGIDSPLARIGNVNDLYARPTLVTEHKDVRDKNAFLKWAKGLIDGVRSVTWKLGQMLQLVKTGGGAAAYFVQPDTSGVDACKTEIQENTRQLSSLSGVPPQKLAFPDLQSNRSVADHSEDLALYDQQRNAWEEGLLSIFRKAVRMQNEITGAPSLDPNAIKEVNMSAQTPELKWALIKQLREDFKAGIVPREFVLQQHPLIEDPEELEKSMVTADAARSAALVDALRERADGDEEETET